MISLQQMLGKEDRFFSLFEDSTAQCCGSVKAIRQLVQSQMPARQEALEELARARRQGKAIHAELNEALCSTVVTALDQADILSLAQALYKIPKDAEKIGERLMLAPAFLEGCDLSSQITLLEQATDTLKTMVQALRQRVTPAQIRDLNHRLQQAEGDADKLMLELFRGLYQSDMEGRRVVFLKDLFELFEKITDHCRDAGNVIVQVVLKSA